MKMPLGTNFANNSQSKGQNGILELDFILEVCCREEIRELLMHIRLPHPDGTPLMLPLDIEQRHHVVAQGLQLPIQDLHWSRHIIQATIDLNIIQRDNRELISHTLPKTRNMEGVVELAELVGKIEPVCNLAHPSGNPKGTNKSGLELAHFQNQMTAFQGDTFRSTEFPT